LNPTISELTTTKTELTETKSELSATKNELIETKSEFNSTKAELSEANDKLSKVNDELSTIKTELYSTTNQLGINKAELIETKSELSTTESELTATKIKLSETTNELCKTKNELSEIKNDLVRTETKLNGYENATKLYGEIYNCMTKCESVNPAFADMGIREPEDNYEALPYSERIKFITHFSPDYGFARIIYNALDNYKNKEHTPITEQEQQLISAINDYYRKLLGKSSYDALDYLDIIKNNKHGKETDFKRQSMKSLTEPRRTDFYTVKDIYVPALRRPDDGSIDKKAIVEAE
ncbi:MAG: hypothetical protein K2J40_09320, partial [Ruminococcus sp.]|nr:hypothetical protein [Ruminococcus sp.]